MFRCNLQKSAQDLDSELEEQLSLRNVQEVSVKMEDQDASSSVSNASIIKLITIRPLWLEQDPYFFLLLCQKPYS